MAGSTTIPLGSHFLHETSTRLARAMWKESPELANVYDALLGHLMGPGLTVSIDGEEVSDLYHEVVVRRYWDEFVRAALMESLVQGYYAFYVAWERVDQEHDEPVPFVLPGDLFVPVRDDGGRWSVQFAEASHQHSSYSKLSPKDCVVVVVTDPDPDGRIQSRAAKAYPFHLRYRQFLAIDVTAGHNGALAVALSSVQSQKSATQFGNAPFMDGLNREERTKAGIEPIGDPKPTKGQTRIVYKTVPVHGHHEIPDTLPLVEAAQHVDLGSSKGNVAVIERESDEVWSWAPLPRGRSDLVSLCEHLSTQIYKVLGIPSLSPTYRRTDRRIHHQSVAAESEMTKQVEIVACQYRGYLLDGFRAAAELHRQMFQRRLSAVLAPHREKLSAVREHQRAIEAHSAKLDARMSILAREVRRMIPKSDLHAWTPPAHSSAATKRETPVLEQDGFPPFKGKESAGPPAKRRRTDRGETPADLSRRIDRMRLRYIEYERLAREFEAALKKQSKAPLISVAFRVKIATESLQFALPHVTPQAQARLLSAATGIPPEDIRVDANLIRGVDPLKARELELRVRSLREHTKEEPKETE